MTHNEAIEKAAKLLRLATPEGKIMRKRLEYLRGEIRAERLSWGEVEELQSLAKHIEPGDAELLEWAGVPENETTKI